jgi:hypothetical protein
VTSVAVVQFRILIRNEEVTVHEEEEILINHINDGLKREQTSNSILGKQRKKTQQRIW